MANLRSIDMLEVDDLFGMGGGFVLDFSDRTFAAFFAHDLNIDIDSDVYRIDGNSKAKRLRVLLRECSDLDAVRVFKALWAYREVIDRRSPSSGLTVNAEARFGALIARLGGGSASAPTVKPGAVVPAFDRTQEDALRAEMVALQSMAPHPRGYAFETFLRKLFEFYNLEPRSSFRLFGEQIDGSFILRNETYLLEAKWHNEPVENTPLHAFHGKLGQKAAWARGLFISYAGFTEGGLASFGMGKNVVCMDGLDLFNALDRHIPIDIVLEKKVRRMAENGRTFMPVRELFP
jgi:restriction endonuclease